MYAIAAETRTCSRRPASRSPSRLRGSAEYASRSARSALRISRSLQLIPVCARCLVSNASRAICSPPPLPLPSQSTNEEWANDADLRLAISRVPAALRGAARRDRVRRLGLRKVNLLARGINASCSNARHAHYVPCLPPLLIHLIHAHRFRFSSARLYSTRMFVRPLLCVCVCVLLASENVVMWCDVMRCDALRYDAFLRGCSSSCPSRARRLSARLALHPLPCVRLYFLCSPAIPTPYEVLL